MSSPRLFGTDGVRGRFGTPPMDESTLHRLGAALARKLGSGRVMLGGDTRDSTPQICRWLAAELEAVGAEPVFLGTVPTPAVAAAVAATDAVCGIAVSASHNPHPDNGVKLIDADGFKWEPGSEAELESMMDEAASGGIGSGDIAEAVLEVDTPQVTAYLEALNASVGEQRLDGLRLGLDAGHGAASPFARHVFESLGAEVTLIGDRPDGTNINQGCGSTAPQALAEKVREQNLDAGIAFDGDADRAILIDGRGEVRDGDAILYLWARDLHQRGELPGDALVATSMSNLGLEVALRSSGISLVRCDVGDREVVRTLKERGLALGGEQSGHIVHLGLSTTGDGLLTALQISSVLSRTQRPLTDLLAGFERFPQLLRNLPVTSKPPLDSLLAVQKEARSVEEELGDQGRLVLRYSGTEPLVRIMIEGPESGAIEALADRLARAFEQESLLEEELQ